jgi:hypothetical protein
VRVNLEAKLGLDACAFDHARNRLGPACAHSVIANVANRYR